MKKYKIEGVQPFNKFSFRSCYYHQLIAALSCFGISFESVLLSSFVFAGKDFDLISKDISDTELEKILGYKDKRSNVSKKKLVKLIKKNYPVIVGIDYYYLEGRSDTYNKLHAPHFILVYGYDLEADLLNVVDHDYRNSFNYIEKTISFNNLLLANKMFRTGIFKRKTTCHILIPKKSKVENNIVGILKKYKKEMLESSCINSKDNLQNLKLMILYNKDELCKKSGKILKYLTGMKSFFTSLYYINLLNETKEMKMKLSNLINAYSNILSIFLRMDSKNDFNYIEKYKEQTFRKIDLILSVEDEIFTILNGVFQ